MSERRAGIWPRATSQREYLSGQQALTRFAKSGVKRSQTLLSQIFARLDPNPNSRVDAWIQFLALIAACAVVIYCVKRHNASADADAIANPTLFKRLLNA